MDEQRRLRNKILLYSHFKEAPRICPPGVANAGLERSSLVKPGYKEYPGKDFFLFNPVSPGLVLRSLAFATPGGWRRKDLKRKLRLS